MDREDRHPVAADVPEQNRQSMSRILVIGATGLIGSRIAARLAANGHRVVGVARDIAAATRRMPAVAPREPRDLAGGGLGKPILLLYAVAGTVLTPWLWLDPLAPLLKIAPVIALLLVALATLEDR